MSTSVVAPQNGSVPAGGGSSSGGKATNRGVLVQTVVALLEVLEDEVRFESLTLEPQQGDDQFDFIWSRGAQIHATQVKSSKNTFELADVRQWAEKLETARQTEHCTLMLVGRIHKQVAEMGRHGQVTIKTKDADVEDPKSLSDLTGHGAHLLASFLPKVGVSHSTPQQREGMFDALEGHLIRKAATGTPMSFDQVSQLMRDWFDVSIATPGNTSAYPRVVESINRELAGCKQVAQLLQVCMPDWFQGGGKEAICLAEFAGKTRLDFKTLLDAILDRLNDEQRDKAFVNSLDRILGGLLVLAVDPAWALQQREKNRQAELAYPGDTFDKADGSQSVNFLNLVLCAVADQICRFGDLFLCSSAEDDRRLPGVDALMRGIRPTDQQTEMKLNLIEFMRGIIQHVQKRSPSTKEDIDKLFEEVREQIEDAFANGRPFHATHDSFRLYVEMLKKDMRLGSLLLIFPAGGSESDIVTKAHLLVTRLHRLRDELKRYC